MEFNKAIQYIATALEYPTTETPSAIQAAKEALQDQDVDVIPANAGIQKSLDSLGQFLDSTSLEQSQEAYTRLFDLQPACTPHLGYHLFGDTYIRGALLAELVAEYRQRDLSLGHELPDYVPHVLRLWASLPAEDRTLLQTYLLAPGFNRLCFAARNIDSPWIQVLQALAALWPAEEEVLKTLSNSRAQTTAAEHAKPEVVLWKAGIQENRDLQTCLDPRLCGCREGSV